MPNVSTRLTSSLVLWTTFFSACFLLPCCKITQSQFCTLFAVVEFYVLGNTRFLLSIGKPVDSRCDIRCGTEKKSWKESLFKRQSSSSWMNEEHVEDGG
ncbi:hypothetical protein AC579_8211 [Pseudocercospora musae]|uniref:Uncharacterized protein n=1 Tax=Pseudocercospora musae TaxID=113226 RepID=A0A139IVI1_9PEZI|nr:hypothetical protein AC579_8211 [Pseudocercospora musae]